MKIVLSQSDHYLQELSRHLQQMATQVDRAENLECALGPSAIDLCYLLKYAPTPRAFCNFLTKGITVNAHASSPPGKC